MVVTVGGFKIQSVYRGGLLVKINSNTIVAIERAIIPTKRRVSSVNLDRKRCIGWC